MAVASVIFTSKPMIPQHTAPQLPRQSQLATKLLKKRRGKARKEDALNGVRHESEKEREKVEREKVSGLSGSFFAGYILD